MANPDYTKLLHFDNIGDTLLISETENNLKHFFEYGMLEVYGWNDVTYDFTDTPGARLDVLKPVVDENYDDGQVWMAPRKDFVYEQGLDTTSQPIVIDEVLVNGSTITTGFNIDYPGGRVIFDSPVSTTSTVQLEYSYRFVQIKVAENVPWWRELQFGSFDATNVHWSQLSDPYEGDWAIGHQHRTQMPLIIVEGTTSGAARPYEVGNNSMIIRQDITYSVFAESRKDRNNLLDACRYQNDRSIWMFDSQELIRDEIYPLDGNGFLLNDTTYPDWVDGGTNSRRWRRLRWTNTSIDQFMLIHPDLWTGRVKTTCEIII